MSILYGDIQKMNMEELRKNAYSLGSKEEEDGGVTYLGMRVEENQVTKYYQSQNGKYWHKRCFLKDGEIISEEEYIFGRKIKKYEPKHRRR